MCKKKAKLYLDQPIFSLVCFKGRVTVSAGGGGARVGLTNKIYVFEKGVPLKKILFEADTKDEIIENLYPNYKRDLICASSEGDCLIYQLSPKSELAVICRFKSDFHPKEPCQRIAVFNSAGDKIACGGDDSVIRLYKLVDDRATGKINQALIHEIRSHTGPINGLDFSIDGKLLCSASDDKTCRLFSVEKGDLLRKLTFGDTKLSYKFFSCHFSKCEKYLITTQNPDRGKAFLTFWRMNENMDPVTTVNIADNPVSAAVMQREGLFIGIGTSDGYAKIFNTRHMEIDSEVLCHDMVVKGVSFTDDSRALVSAAPDFTYHFLPNVRPEGWFSLITKLWVLSMFLIWLAMFLKDKLF